MDHPSTAIFSMSNQAQLQHVLNSAKKSLRQFIYTKCTVPVEGDEEKRIVRLQEGSKLWMVVGVNQILLCIYGRDQVNRRALERLVVDFKWESGRVHLMEVFWLHFQQQSQSFFHSQNYTANTRPPENICNTPEA